MTETQEKLLAGQDTGVTVQPVPIECQRCHKTLNRGPKNWIRHPHEPSKYRKVCLRCMTREGEDAGTKQCSICAQSLPLTTMHFHQNPTSPDGYRAECKMCREYGANDLVEVGEQVNETLLRLEQFGLSTLAKTAKQPGRGSKVPHIAECFQAIMAVFGGSQGYAQQVAATYYSAKAGSSARIKLLEMVAKMGTKVSDMGAMSRDLRDLSTEDLQRLLAERMQEKMEAATVDADVLMSTTVPIQVDVIDGPGMETPAE